jgi:dihydropteroate synthase
VTLKLYVRPVGPLGPQDIGRLPAVAVAGRSDLAFAALELIERRQGRVRRALRSAADLAAGAERDRFQVLIDRLRAPRPPVAGVGLEAPRLIGVVNVTPDSFSDGGLSVEPDAAIDHARRLEAEGADILEVGGESTRPGAVPVALEEEWRRVLPVVRALAKKSRVPIAIDTRKAEVMRRAALEGVRIINDVSALTHDGEALAVAAASGLNVVLMHARGEPRTMQDDPTYDDVVLDVADFLEARIEACAGAGIARSRLILDPGIGFGKTLAHNLALLASLVLFHALGCPLLLGASRKSFIGALSGARVGERVPGSIAAALAGVAQGVQLLRVHDVAATRQALAVWEGARSFA